MDPQFEPYDPHHREACLAVFDENCPEFFAVNERTDYAAFLDRAGADYRVCRGDDRVVGAFGLMPAGAADEAHLNWILLSPSAQGAGVGRAIMTEVARQAASVNVERVHIAASHKSAPFFARFGAAEVERAVDGWGPGMHRVDMVWRP
jgi:GNAT superfamily N-acetyltransferase